MKKLLPIQILRIICSIFIMINHIDYFNKHKMGAIGVDIFLIISGFVAMLTGKQSSLKYLKKRLKKIIPLYYLLTIFLVLVYLFIGNILNSQFNVKILISSFLFLPIKGSTPVLYVGWTLNYILIFYLLFSISLFLNYEKRGLICSVLIFICIFLINNISILDNLFGFDSTILLDFVYGILLFRVYQKFIKQSGFKNKFSKYILVLLFFFMFNYVEISQKIGFYGYSRSMYLGIPSLIFCIIFLYILNNFRIYNKAYEKIIFLCADITYYVYLIHPFIIRGIIKFLPNEFVQTLSFSLIILTVYLIAICFIASYIIYFLFKRLVKKFEYKFF